MRNIQAGWRADRLVVMSFVACGFLFLCACYGACAQEAEVIGSDGAVEVLFDGADDYAAVEEGMILEANDRIRTSSGASVELSFNEADTNLVRMSENTDATMTLSEEEKIEMTAGEVFASVAELAGGSSFEIRTPTAVSGARGTEWVTKVSDEGTDVEAIDSVPYVRHFEPTGVKSGRMTMIQPGQMTTVRKFQQPMKPRAMAADRQRHWSSMKQEVRKRAGEAAAKRRDRPKFDRKDFIREMKGRQALSQEQQLKRQTRELKQREQLKQPARQKAKEIKMREDFHLKAQHKAGDARKEPVQENALKK